MKLKNWIYIGLFFSILLLSSCKKDAWDVYAKHAASILTVKDYSVKEVNKSIQLSFKIDKNSSIAPEYLASIGLISFTDTAIQLLKEKSIESIDVTIEQDTAKPTFHYLTKDLLDYKKSLEISAFFINNFLNKKNIESASIVDENLISAENLSNLDTISHQISSTSPFKAYTFDGFKINKEDPNVIQLRVQLHTEAATIISTVQYHRLKSMVFYFGINDEL